MGVSKEFMDIVANESLLNVKVTLKQCALYDKSLKTFDDALEYAQKKLGSELIEDHDGETFNNNPSEWNEEYAMKVASDLVFNFSQERIDHLRKVFKKVYPNAKLYEESTPSHVSLNESPNGKVVGEKILSERVIEKGSKSPEGKVKTNPNSDKEEKVREIPGSARTTETMGSKFENTAGKAAGAVLMAGGAVAAVAGAAVGSTGVAVAGAAALAAGVAVTVLSSNKKD